MKRSYKYNEENPLFQYYNEIRKQNRGKRVDNWKILSDETGLPVQTVISVARKQNKEDINRMLLGTYFKIKNSIGIDMLSFNKVGNK